MHTELESKIYEVVRLNPKIVIWPPSMQSSSNRNLIYIIAKQYIS